MSDANDTQDTENAAAENARSDDFGRALRRAREKAGLSVADVAKALKLTERTVDALEAERYEDLPPRPYVRGYVLRYARVVGLDASTVTIGSRTVDEAESVAPSVVPRSRASSFSDFARESWGLLYGCIVLVFIIVIAGALWWAWSGENTNPAEPEFDPVPDVAEAPFDDDNPGIPAPAEAVSTIVEQEPSAAPPTVQPELPDARTPDAPTDGLPEPLSAEIETSPPDESDADAGADADETPTDGDQSAKPDMISFVFQEDCWVEVRDRDGDLLHGDLGRSGDTVSLTGNAPFSILVGYAAGVEVTFNGERVALDPGTRGEVAKLVVGH